MRKRQSNKNQPDMEDVFSEVPELLLCLTLISSSMNLLQYHSNRQWCDGISEPKKKLSYVYYYLFQNNNTPNSS